MSYNSELVIKCTKEDTRIIHNCHEILCVKSVKCGKYIEFIQFKEIINNNTFIPNIKIIKKCQYNLCFDEVKELLGQIQNCQCGTFIILSFMNLKYDDIPYNLHMYLKNKLMASFLFTCDKNKPGSWCILLYRIIDKADRIPTEPRPLVSPCVFKFNNANSPTMSINSRSIQTKNKCIEFVPNLCNSIQKNLAIETINWDFNYRNSGTWLYLGEAFSYEIAEICINLKILPYISNRTKPKII